MTLPKRTLTNATAHAQQAYTVRAGRPHPFTSVDVHSVVSFAGNDSAQIARPTRYYSRHPHQIIMTTSRLPQTQAPRGHTSLIAHVSSHPAGQVATYLGYNENTWRAPLGHENHPTAIPRSTPRASRNGPINKVRSSAAGQPVLYSDRDTADRRRRLNAPQACPLPGPANPQEAVTFNRNGIPTSDRNMWREEQRMRNTPVAPNNAAEVNNSD